jgi:hypothetical protein
LKDLKTNLQDQLTLNKTLTSEQLGLRDTYDEVSSIESVSGFPIIFET